MSLDIKQNNCVKDIKTMENNREQGTLKRLRNSTRVHGEKSKSFLTFVFPGMNIEAVIWHTFAKLPRLSPSFMASESPAVNGTNESDGHSHHKVVRDA